MEAPSELMQFLRSQQEEGKRDSEGHFTLAREKAVVKMAEFQLPIPEAWIVKVVQALVAQGQVRSITVQLTATETRVQALTDGWDLDQLEAAYFLPDALGQPHLQHLMVGLWTVAIKDKRAFQLTLPGEAESLRWNGEVLGRSQSEPREGVWSLTVTHGSPRDGYGGLISNLGHRKRNVDLLSALTEYCFACPVPLRVDGRRLDSLQFAISAGWLHDTVPLGMGFVRGDFPALRVPPGTFEDIASFGQISSGQAHWDSLSRSLMRDLEPVEECQVATLLTVHPSQSYLVSEWSKILWVQDGAVTDAQPLVHGTTHMVAGCFVSAQGLPTDLTTLTLRENPERQHRVARVRAQVLAMLRENRNVDYTKFRVKNHSKASAAILFLSGIGTLWAAPGLAGLLLLGSLAAANREPHGQRQLRQVDGSIVDLIRELEKVAK